MQDLGCVLTSFGRVGTVGMEQYFMVSLTKKLLLIGYQNRIRSRFQAFPPCLKKLEEEEEVFKQ